MIFPAALVALLLLGGCSAASKSEIFTFSDTEPIELRIVTEQTASDGMNAEAQRFAEQFQEEHKNVTVRLDILPTEEEARNETMAELQSSAAADRWPDIYLLPTPC